MAESAAKFIARKLRAMVAQEVRTGNFLGDPGSSTGQPYVGCGVAPSVGYPWFPNIWRDVFGGTRIAWRNGHDGSEATWDGYRYGADFAVKVFAAYTCNSESLVDSDPWNFLFNELHDVIDAMCWKPLTTTSTGLVYQQASSSGSGLTEQQMLDALWAAWLAASPTSSGAVQSYSAFTLDTWGSVYGCRGLMGESRSFFSASVPAAAVAMKAFLTYVQNNYVGLQEGPGPDYSTLVKIWADQSRGQTPPPYGIPPAWTASMNVGTADPSPYGAGEWSYGAPCSSWTVPSIYSYTGTYFASPVASAITGFTAGSTNFFELIGEDASEPNWTVNVGGTPCYIMNAAKVLAFPTLIYRVSY